MAGVECNISEHTKDKEELRRVIYVALTRAVYKCYILQGTSRKNDIKEMIDAYKGTSALIQKEYQERGAVVIKESPSAITFEPRQVDRSMRVHSGRGEYRFSALSRVPQPVHYVASLSEQ